VFVPCEVVAGLSSSADSACVVGRGMTTMKIFFGVVLMKGDVKVAVIGYQLGCSECLL
jgi:precorrin-4 methylase